MADRPLSFCMVTTFYPPHNFGGDGIYVHRLSNELARRGHRVTVVSAVAAVRELLAGADRPTAVFAADDTLAAGVMRAAHSLGLAVPEDLAVVGFDDGELAEALGLTTVRQPLEESGRAAAELLAVPKSTLHDKLRRLGIALRRDAAPVLEAAHCTDPPPSPAIS